MSGGGAIVAMLVLGASLALATSCGSSRAASGVDAGGPEDSSSGSSSGGPGAFSSGGSSGSSSGGVSPGADCDSGSVFAGPVTVAPGLDGPAHLALDALSMYWATPAAAVQKVSKCGGPVTTLWTGAAGKAPPIAVDDRNVYWKAGGNVYACAKDGCGANPTALASGADTGYAGDVAVVGGNVFWTDVAAGSTAGADAVYRCATGGCAMKPSTFATDQGIAAMVAWPTGVYWSDAVGAAGTAAVMMCGLANCPGGPYRVFATPGAVDMLAIGGTNVYAASLGRLYECDEYGCNGFPGIVAEGVYKAALAADDASVYWTDGSGSLLSISNLASSPASPPTTLASGLEAPTSLAVDADSVYWADAHTGKSDGTIMRSPKSK